jgi:signal peptidase I
MSNDAVTETENKGVAPDAEKLTLGQRVLAEVKFFAGLAVVMLAFLTFVWGHYKIPSESMQPTLEVGDHLYVSKFAYGYSRHSPPFGLHKLPFLKDGKIFSKIPKRGDVAVFRNPKTGIVMIKRVTGLPGDTIRMHRGRLFINDVLVPRENIDNFLYRQHLGSVTGVDVFKETLPDMKSPIIIYEQTDGGNLDTTEKFLVPEGHLFFMGDNRDNSLDSRAFMGPVPLDHLIGRADLMMFSFKRCKKEENLYCPPFRAMKKL